MVAVLPCYMALQRGDLERLLLEELSIERTYWIAVHGDQANSPRVRTLMQQIERHTFILTGLFSCQAECAQRANRRPVAEA